MIKGPGKLKNYGFPRFYREKEMGRINWKGSVLLAPVPSVMVTCGKGDEANIITIGWCGVVSSKPPRVYISVRPERHSHRLIEENGEFVINLTPSSMVEICDYVGTVTGRCVKKAEKTGLSLIQSEKVEVPTIEQCPLALECRVFQKLSMGSHDMYLADVISVSVDEKLIDSDGKLRLDRVNLLVYSHGEYFETGKKLGPIGTSMTKGKRGKFAKVGATAPVARGKGRKSND